MKTTISLALLALAALTACPRAPVPPAPEPGDGGTELATCAGWCRHAADLLCEAAHPTPAGSPCEAVCTNVQASGVVTWNLKCRVAARSCAAADACEQGK